MYIKHNINFLIDKEKDKDDGKLRMRVKWNNSRKEFFKVEIKEIRDKIETQNLHAKWTMTAEATEYRETMAIEKSHLN